MYKESRALGVSCDFAGLQAGGAHVQALRRARNDCTYALDVGIPAPLGAAMRVRNVVAEAGALAADVAVGSHGSIS